MNKTACYLAVAAAAACCAAHMSLNSAHMAAQETEVHPAPSGAVDKGAEQNTVVVPEDSPVRKRLVFDSPKQEDIQPTFLAPAAVEADPARFARIYPPLSGRIMTLNVHLGDSVNEGQLLATLDAPDFNEAQSDAFKARSGLDLADKTLARLFLLLEHGVAAQKDVEQARTDRDVARSELERAQTRLRMYTQLHDQKPGEAIAIKSPISGTVIDLAVGRGEFRNDAAAAMMTIADLSTVWIAANVQEKDIRNVLKDGEVTAALSAYPEETFSGKVLFVGEMLDQDTRSVKVRIAFPNPEDRLKPGMFATATFRCPSQSVITVPNTAIFQIHGTSHVFVEIAPWTFEPREIKTGTQTADHTIVLAGLQTADRIVAREGSLLQ